jgi:predicted dehydrogenase
MRAFGVAVVGTGFIGPVHIEALRRLGHRVVGVLGSSPEKSRLAAASLGIDKGYASYDELLNDRDVNVVHLTSPNKAHFEQCKRAFAAGKHIVCEKPLAMNSIETSELVKLAQASKLVAAVNYNVRYYPINLESRERRIAGGLGRLLHINGSYLQDWLLHDTDFNWRVLAEEGGPLRAVADIGTHWLDLIGFISGLEVESVCADLMTVHPIRKSIAGSVETFQAVDASRPFVEVPIDTEDYGSILLRFKGGARGSLTVSQVCAGRKNCIRYDIAGSQASLAWNSEEPNELRIGQRDRASELLPRDPGLLSSKVRAYANYPGGHAEGFPDSFKQLFRAVYEAIETGQSGVPYPTFEDGHREVVLCEAIMASHRERRWVDVR